MASGAIILANLMAEKCGGRAYLLPPTFIIKMEKRNTLKENWLKVDETCPTCGQVTKQVRGLTKQNLRKLIVPKWDMTEVIITLLLIALIGLSLLYKIETQQSRDFLKPLYEDGGANCLMVCNNKCSLIRENAIGGSPDFSCSSNLTNITECLVNR